VALGTQGCSTSDAQLMMTTHRSLVRRRVCAGLQLLSPCMRANEQQIVI